jgi:hypothetical protein
VKAEEPFEVVYGAFGSISPGCGPNFVATALQKPIGPTGRDARATVVDLVTVRNGPDLQLR